MNQPNKSHETPSGIGISMLTDTNMLPSEEPNLIWTLDDSVLDESFFLGYRNKGSLSSPFQAEDFMVSNRYKTVDSDFLARHYALSTSSTACGLQQSTLFKAVRLNFMSMVIVESGLGIDLMKYRKCLGKKEKILVQTGDLTGTSLVYLAPNGTLFIQPDNKVDNRLIIPSQEEIIAAFSKNKLINLFFEDKTIIDYSIVFSARPTTKAVRLMYEHLFSNKKIPKKFIHNVKKIPFYFDIDPLAKVTNRGGENGTTYCNV